MVEFLAFANLGNKADLHISLISVHFDRKSLQLQKAKEKKSSFLENQNITQAE